MQINRKTFPGLYWLGRGFVSLVAAMVVMALLEPLGWFKSGTLFLTTLGILWIAGIVGNIPKWMGLCLDGLWRFITAMTRVMVQGIRHAITAFIAAVNLVFWPVVAGFLTWKLCEWVWRMLS